MADVHALALDAASHWGGVTRPPRLIGDRENAVFEVQLANGPRAALRLHRMGYQSEKAIASELLWTEALAASGFPCPAPVRTHDGALTVKLAAGRRASVVTWIDAAPIGENGVPFAGAFADQVALYEKLGRLIARMHKATDAVDAAEFCRPSWGADALLGDAPHWGAFWSNPALTTAEHDLLQTARTQAAQHLEAVQDLDIGLIHADLLQENILQNGDGLHVIDFDDSGVGYRLFDLGTALIQHAEHPNLPELSQALCGGYGCATTLMPLFMMLRSMASCGWIISRAPADDPRQRFYAGRALRCAHAYLGA